MALTRQRGNNGGCSCREMTNTKALVGGRGEGKPTGGWREGQGRLEKPRTRWGRRAGRGKVRKVGGSRLNRNLQMMDRGASLYPSDDVPPLDMFKAEWHKRSDLHFEKLHPVMVPTSSS